LYDDSFLFLGEKGGLKMKREQMYQCPTNNECKKGCNHGKKHKKNPGCGVDVCCPACIPVPKKAKVRR